MKTAKIFIALTFLLAFAVGVSAQEIEFPNELKGYEFFRSGKLKDLQLKFSSKDDVKKIFGANCEAICDYDKKWIITFGYFDDDTIETVESGKKTTLVFNSKYIGKLSSISLRPKTKISFKEVIFTSKFQIGTGWSRKLNGLGDGAVTFYRIYEDETGLAYEIFDRINLVKPENSNNWQKDDLMLIEYGIPERLREKMYVLQK